MTQIKERNYYPLSFIPAFSGQVAELVEILEAQLKAFSPAKNKPHVLDDQIINRASSAFKANAEYIQLYQEQTDKWMREAQTETHRQALSLLNDKLSKARKLNVELVALVEELGQGTIDKVLAKDDLEFALDFLSGKSVFDI